MKVAAEGVGELEAEVGLYAEGWDARTARGSAAAVVGVEVVAPLHFNFIRPVICACRKAVAHLGGCGDSAFRGVLFAV